MKSTIQIVLLFLGTLAIMILDPLGLNPSIFSAFYLIPTFILWYYLFVTPTISKRGVFDDPKYLNALKGVLVVLGYLIAAGIKIPIISQISEAIQAIVSQWSELGSSVDVLIALFISLKAIFSTKESALGKLAIKLDSGHHDVNPRTRDV